MAYPLTWYGILKRDGSITFGTESPVAAHAFADMFGEKAAAVVKCTFKSRRHLEACLPQ